VEGLAEQKKQQQGDGTGNWSWFWWTLLGLLVLNWILSSALLGAAARTTVPYKFFVRQVTADNVTQVTSTGNTIQGTFRHQVRYPPGTKNAQQVAEFSTERPTFANDHLFQQLQARGVMVNAKPPDQGARCGSRCCSGSGPGCCSPGCCGGSGGAVG
jgi:cell division protease FtsH